MVACSLLVHAILNPWKNKYSGAASFITRPSPVALHDSIWQLPTWQNVAAAGLCLPRIGSSFRDSVRQTRQVTWWGRGSCWGLLYLFHTKFSKSYDLIAQFRNFKYTYQSQDCTRALRNHEIAYTCMDILNHWHMLLCTAGGTQKL